MSEASIQARILLAIGALPGVRVFRNTVGTGWHGEPMRPGWQGLPAGEYLVLKNPRRVSFGLFPGSHDIIGWRTLQTAPGLSVAQFLGIEVKTAKGVLSSQQSRFGSVLSRAGGLSLVARSPEEALALLEKGT